MFKVLTFRFAFVALLAFLPSEAFSLTFKTLAQDFSPKFFTINRRMQGYSIDIMNALEKIDPEIKFSGQQDFATIPRIEADLESGQLDLFVGAFKTSEREAKFSFIDIPLYEFRYLMAVRADDNIDIKSFADIRKLQGNNFILTLLGTRMHSFLKDQKGLNIDASAINFSSNLEKLISARGRFFFATDVSLFNEIDRKKIRILPTVFDQESQYIMLSKTISDEKKKRLTEALKTLKNSGQLEAIFQTYQHKGL